MKKLFIILILIMSANTVLAETWNISQIYESKEAPYKAKALDSYGKPIMSYGRLETIQKILIPCSIESGQYKITLNKVTDSFFHIEGTNYYLEMNGTSYFGPFSLYNTKAEVILEIGIFGSKIVYER